MVVVVATELTGNARPEQYGRATMRRTHLVVLALGLIGHSGCGPSAENEAVYKDFIAASNERNAVFRGIKDGKSAGEARSGLREVNQRLAALAGKVKKVPDGDRKKLAEKYKAELAASWEECGEHVSRFLQNGLMSRELLGDVRSADDLK
jgi:hypothetical protein